MQEGDRWIAFAYNAGDREQRLLSLITGFFECTRELTWEGLPAKVAKRYQCQNAWTVKGSAGLTLRRKSCQSPFYVGSTTPNGTESWRSTSTKSTNFRACCGEKRKSAGAVDADLESAKALAEADKYQFQYWALGLIGARPATSQEKKGADKGIDGRLYITDASGDVKSIIISVKGGHVSVPQLRGLRGVVERENAAIGAFICLEELTKPMRREAADAGFYENKSGVGSSQHPRLQLLTIEDLLNGKRLDLPLQQELRSFKQAPKTKSKAAENFTLGFGDADK